MNKFILINIVSICLILTSCRNNKNHLSLPEPIHQTSANESNIAPKVSTIEEWLQETIVKAKKYTTADSVFFPLYSNFKNNDVIKKNAGLYAITLHKGDYYSVGKTYEYLIKSIKDNNYKMIGPSFEYCILDSLTSYNTNDYITKIVIPIKPI